LAAKIAVVLFAEQNDSCVGDGVGGVGNGRKRIPVLL